MTFRPPSRLGEDDEEYGASNSVVFSPRAFAIFCCLAKRVGPFVLLACCFRLKIGSGHLFSCFVGRRARLFTVS